MNKNEIEKRFSDIEDLLLKLTETKPSRLRSLWNWCKPYIIPFILGMIVGGLLQHVAIAPQPQATTIERQAATGGAAIPFLNVSPLQSHLNSLLGDSTELLGEGEIAGTPSMSTSAPPLPLNQQVDSGQAPSTRLLRPLIRQTQ